MEQILTLEPVFYLHTDYAFHFIVLGVGGTGSELVPKLCRQLSLLRYDDSVEQRHAITICDADVVEDKNLIRQNFFAQDLGKNKAEIMALKCSTMFDMTVNAVPRYVETEEELLKLVYLYPDKVPFIVGCVDNTATRKLVHEVISKGTIPLVFYIDSGNEEYAGQVALGCYPTIKNYLYISDEVGLFYIPDVTFHHPEMLETEDKFASELSCAERALSNPQAAITNVEAANILFQMISHCLLGAIDYHYVSFDTKTSKRSVKFNTLSALKEFGVGRLPRDTAEKPKKNKPTPDPAASVTSRSADNIILSSEDGRQIEIPVSDVRDIIQLQENAVEEVSNDRLGTYLDTAEIPATRAELEPLTETLSDERGAVQAGQLSEYATEAIDPTDLLTVL